MFFYTSLFIASLVAALVILWAYHAIADAGSALMRTMLPSPKKGPTIHLSARPMPTTTINGTKTPWGWKNHDTPAHQARAHAAMPTSEQLDECIEVEPDKPGTLGRTWVHREERSELGGKAYKVTRQVSDTAEGFKDADRPWGW